MKSNSSIMSAMVWFFSLLFNTDNLDQIYCLLKPHPVHMSLTHFPSLIRTGEAARESIWITLPLLRSICPNVSTPVGHDWTHALHLTHSGSFIGRPLLAKFIMSIPWWQTEVHTLQEMHFFLSAKILKRLNLEYMCISAASGHMNLHQTLPLYQK